MTMTKVTAWIVAVALIGVLGLLGCGPGQASQSEIDATANKMKQDTAGQKPVPMPDLSTAPSGGGGKK